MKQFVRRCVLLAWAVSAMPLGCHADPPRADTKHIDQPAQLLSQLTSSRESERFGVLDQALQQVAVISLEDLETALTALRKKNVSTLIYVYIQSRNEILYHLSAPSRMALENATGAFPNMAYYYAQVKPDAGMDELLRLYRRHPEERTAICMAMGEIGQNRARDFLLTEARHIKSSGGRIVDHLFGLKSLRGAVAVPEVLWFLDQKLEREEIIALADLKVRFADDQLKSLWRSTPIKRQFAVERILGAPDAYFDALRWMIAQYLEAGDADSARELLLSDSLRTAAAPRIQRYRDATLKKISEQ